MTEAHWVVLLSSLAYSLPTVLLFYVIIYAAGRAILKAPPWPMGATIGFVVAWVFIGFILPFKSVKYYEDNIYELFLMALIASFAVTIAVCKFSAFKSRRLNQGGSDKKL